MFSCPRNAVILLGVCGAKSQIFQNEVSYLIENMSVVSMNVSALIENGLSTLTQAFHLCSPLKSMDDVGSLMDWLENSWFNLAMGM